MPLDLPVCGSCGAIVANWQQHLKDHRRNGNGQPVVGEFLRVEAILVSAEDVRS